MRHHERIIMLSVIDQQWKDHLLSMDHLREGIGLRGYAQHDPLVEYKRESFDMFEAMMERFEEETVRYLYLMQVIERADDGAGYSSGGPIDGGTLGGPGVPVPAGGSGNGQAPKRSRAVTSIDDMEAEFQRRKRRELDQARMAGASSAGPIQQVVRGDKVGRNDPCPCGSGKKYKKCCGA
jgi:preprotein translocase subunit SecA